VVEASVVEAAAIVVGVVIGEVSVAATEGGMVVVGVVDMEVAAAMYGQCPARFTRRTTADITPAITVARDSESRS